MHIAGYRPNLSESKKPETGFLNQLFNHRSPRVPRGTSEAVAWNSRVENCEKVRNGLHQEVLGEIR